MKSPFITLLIGLFIFSISQITKAQMCSCSDYIYINEIGSSGINSGSIHKYEIMDDGSLVEILDNGEPWKINVTDPHGSGLDANGYYYFANREGGYGPNWNLQRVDCNGNTVASDITENTVFNATNIVVQDPYLYAIEGNCVTVTEICSGTRLDQYCLQITGNGLNEFGAGTHNWSLELGADGNLYVASPWNLLQSPGPFTLEVYQFSTDWTTWPSDGNVPPYFTQPNFNNQAFGLATDSNGNFYIIETESNGTNFFPSTISKYDSNGNLLGSITDDVYDFTGFGEAAGIDYSSESGYLYVTSFAESCITIIDPVTMEIVAEGLPYVAGTTPKSLNLVNQCCIDSPPNPYNTTLCTAGDISSINLRDLLPCSNLCNTASMWSAPADVEIDACHLTASFTNTTFPACLTYNSATESCPGTNSFEVCIAIADPIVPEISIVDNNCSAGIEGTIDVLSPCGIGTTLEYSIDNGITWSDIAPIYDETTPISVMARCVNNANPTCFSNNSAVVMSNPEICPPIYDVALTKTVDNNLSSIGSTVVFIIEVENLNDAVTGATVTDVLPTGLTLLGYTATTGTYNGMNWVIGNMAQGEIETIEITANIGSDGVFINSASIEVNESETKLFNNADSACISVPIESCNNAPINIGAIAGAGLMNYQWYKDGVLISGATIQTYTITEAGSYTYTADGAPPTGDCMGELCCPIVVELISCCPPVQCAPITITTIKL